MKQSFKKQLKMYKSCDKLILDFMDKNDYSILEVTQFGVFSGIPLVIIYYYFWRDQKIEDAKENLMRLLEFYDTEFDITERG